MNQASGYSLILAVASLAACSDTDPVTSSLPPTTAFMSAHGNVPHTEQCTLADAQTVFNNWLGAVKLGLRATNPSTPADAFTQCQYRLYVDGETVMFREGDVFLGGVNVNWDFETLDALGVSRQAAIADLEATETRVWLARLETDGTPGALIEQPLLRTPYKDGMHPVLGRFVQQHRAFITSLRSGEYISVFEAKWDEFHGFPAGELHATVRLVITP